jgi:hypothetical protein
MDFNTKLHIPPGIWVLIAAGVIVAALALYGYLTGAWDLPPDASGAVPLPRPRPPLAD